jgi:predicted  nucleic acid-binding Zn-ribbon protein
MAIRFNQVILDKLKKGRQETLSKKVDLALVDDINNAINDSVNRESEAEDVVKQMESIGSDIESLATRLSDLLDLANDTLQKGYEQSDVTQAVLDEVLRNANELGLEMNDIPGASELSEYAKVDYTRIKAIEDTYWSAISPSVGLLKDAESKF